MAKAKTPTVDPTPAVTPMFMAFNPVGTQAWLDLMSDCMRFAAERLQEDLNTQRDLMACRTPADVAKVQTEWCTTAARQYSDQFARMFQKTNDAAQQTAKDAASGFSRNYDDIPL
ncbi:MAG: phasin family protein [Tateyamaria sp.]